jgi:hypothetical protein
MAVPRDKLGAPVAVHRIIRAERPVSGDRGGSRMEVDGAGPLRSRTHCGYLSLIGSSNNLFRTSTSASLRKMIEGRSLLVHKALRLSTNEETNLDRTTTSRIPRRVLR